MILGIQLRSEDHSSLEEIEESQFDLAYPRLRPFSIDPSDFSPESIYGNSLLDVESNSGRVHLDVVRLPRVVDDLFEEPNEHNTVRLIEACMYHPEEIVRVSAASLYGEVVCGDATAMMIVKSGIDSTNPTIGAIAIAAATRFSTNGSQTMTMAASPHGPAASPTQTSIVVHGSLAQINSWWKPGGNFNTFLKNGISSNVYSNQDYFSWGSGT